jgi:hypothetical protein
MPPTTRAHTMDGRRLHRALVVMIHTLTFGLALALIATAAWGQMRPTVEDGARHWFRVSWAPPTDGAGTIKGSVFNDSQDRVTDVGLRIEGLDADRPKIAVESAVNDALDRAIAFTPTVVTLQSVRRIGDRIYLQLLIVDRDGEALMKQLGIDPANEADEPATEDSDDDGQTL